MYGGADSGSQVGGAEGEEAKSVVVGEWHALFDVVDGADETTEDLAKITTHLHGDDAKVILFVAPDQEGLGVIVVDATAGGPEPAGVGGLEETVTFLEEEVVVDEFLLDLENKNQP